MSYTLRDSAAAAAVQSLSGVGSTAVSITIPASPDNNTVVVQAMLLTNGGYRVLVRLGGAPTITNYHASLRDGEAAYFLAADYTTLQLLVINASGTASNGGANDYCMVRFSNDLQVR